MQAWYHNAITLQSITATCQVTTYDRMPNDNSRPKSRKRVSTVTLVKACLSSEQLMLQFLTRTELTNTDKKRACIASCTGKPKS